MNDTLRAQSEIIHELELEVADRAVAHLNRMIDWIGEGCESPIERVMLGALIMEKIEGIAIWPKRSEPYDLLSLRELSGDPGRSHSHIGAIYPQMTFGGYRVDFYMEAYDVETGRLWYRSAIECDGHNFHETTKEQARRDKRRDRWFQGNGITVLRFAGSEIWGNPLSCAEQVNDAFCAALRRHTDLW